MKSTKILFSSYFFLLAFLFGCGAQKEIPKSVALTVDWVEETLKRLTVEEKISQMIMPRALGYYLNVESDEYKRLIHLVKEKKVGGFCFFQGDVYATASTINQLQKLSDVSLLVSADFERGGPMRIRRMTPFPEAMALGASRRIDLAFKMGQIVAAEARAIGVHQNFAPVADINNNPQNPVINTRSYSESPELVADISSAYASGMQSAGLIATAKHFPGHGDVDIDSHLDLPKVNFTRARLDSVELYPFKKLIDKGIMSVMTAHIAVTSIDSHNIIPATLSKKISTDLLQNELEFKGLIVTDALEMKGITKLFGVDEAAVKAVEAGADILLLPPDEDAAIDAVKRAVGSGRIPIERINKSVRKILEMKKWLNLPKNRLVDLDQIKYSVSSPEHLKVAKEIAQSSITVLKNDQALPLNTDKKTLAVIISDNDDYRTEVNRSSNYNPNERVGDYLISELKNRIPRVQAVRLSPRSNKLDFESVLTQMQNYENVIFSLFVKTRSGSNAVGLPQHLVDFVNEWIISDTTSTIRKNIIVSFGNPYILGAIKPPLQKGAVVCTYSDGELSTEALVEILCGETEAKGKLPVTIPNAYSFGSGLTVARSTLYEDKYKSESKFFKVDSIVNSAVKDNAFPGAQLIVVKDGEILHKKNYGKLDYSPNSFEVNDDVLYDLASLTKVVGTTTAIMKLLDESKINLEDRITAYLPEFGSNGKENITIKNLLLHNSGLPAWEKFYLTCKTAGEVLDSIYNSRLIYKTGDSTVYSDFGFIVLGKVIETITGMTLDKYLSAEFFEPLGMKNTFFKPSLNYVDRIAPTENDTVWRKRVVRGTVHDETADLLGGVSGHAGLFSNTSDLAIFVQMILNGGSYGGVEYLKPETIKLFTEKNNNKQQRGLGWDFKSLEGYSSAGSLFGTKSFGHTGFTGTSIWVDPERNLFVIFLTNRVHPTRANTKISKVRPAVHDAVIQAVE
jgi:beta-N-acetylhexosaminidase